MTEPAVPAAAGTGGRAATRTVNLALQGGGSHGAFTWGVLDRLLEDGRVAFEGLSGTSAGAMNAAVMAYGLATGGRERARDLLDVLWRRVASHTAISPLQPGWFERLTGNPNLETSPVYHGFDLLIRLMSPYQFNPLNLNPLREVLLRLIDFERLRRIDVPRLFVNATNVTRGKLRVFTGADISVEALLASACLPFLFQAVEIDGEFYWDGGYMANPTLYPLIHECRSSDIVVVQVTPIGRDLVPMAPTAIVDRINEISFSSTYQHEVRTMALISRLIEQGHLDGAAAGLRPMFLHVIGDERHMERYTVSSKLNGDYGFIAALRDLGRHTADRWLEANFDRLGRESTVETESLLA